MPAAKATPEAPTTLAGALAAVQTELPVVPKSHTAKVRTNSGADYSYTYADLADVTAAVLPLLGKYGLAFTALPQQTDAGFVLVGTLLHTSGEKVEGSLPLFGRDAQSIGSSLTYMRRYLLGCLTGVVTDDDDDGRAARGAQTQQRRPQQVPPPDPGYSAGSTPPAPPNGSGPEPGAPEPQALADMAHRVRSLDSLRDLHRQAQQKQLLGAPVAHPRTGEVVALSAFLLERKTEFEQEPA